MLRSFSWLGPKHLTRATQRGSSPWLTVSELGPRLATPLRWARWVAAGRGGGEPLSSGGQERQEAGTKAGPRGLPPVSLARSGTALGRHWLNGAGRPRGWMSSLFSNLLFLLLSHLHRPVFQLRRCSSCWAWPAVTALESFTAPHHVAGLACGHSPRVLHGPSPCGWPGLCQVSVSPWCHRQSGTCLLSWHMLVTGPSADRRPSEALPPAHQGLPQAPQPGSSPTCHVAGAEHLALPTVRARNPEEVSRSTCGPLHTGPS